MSYEKMLLDLAKKVEAMKIPNFMNASDVALSDARKQKYEIFKEIHRIRKLMQEDENK